MGVIVIVGKIPAIDIVDISVSIIIDTVSGDLTGVDPDVGRQIRMVDIAAGVYDGDDDICTSGGDIPGVRSVHVNA